MRTYRALIGLALLLFGALAAAQNSVAITPSSPVLDTRPDVYRSTTKIASGVADLQACIAAIKADAAARAPGTYSYGCRLGNTPITATVTLPPALGTAMLAWTPPVSPDVTGYRIYWGAAPGAYVQALGAGILVPGALTAAHTITDLPAGRTYYFAVTAVAADGRESGYSNEAAKAIP